MEGRRVPAKTVVYKAHSISKDEDGLCGEENLCCGWKSKLSRYRLEP